MTFLDQQNSSVNPPSTAAFDPPVVGSAVEHGEELEQARAADHLWREERRGELEKQLNRGRRLHHRLIKPLITALGLALIFWLMPLAQDPAGIGVDLSSDWALAQWCARFVICLALMFIPQVLAHRWALRKFAAWEGRLRQELGPDEDE